MSVPLTLLGLLERGPSHGYDLKRDYDMFFGRGKPVRYSQVYATLSRLARDGKAVAGPVEQGAGPEEPADDAADVKLSEIQGLETATVAVLEDAGYRTLNDVIDLEREDLLRLPGIAPEEADRIMAIIDELTEEGASDDSSATESGEPEATTETSQSTASAVVAEPETGTPAGGAST
jgi:hypothetical protein